MAAGQLWTHGKRN